VHKLLCEGYTDVVDADLSKYFDTIPHSELMQCVARRIVDRDMLHLIKMWLKVPIEERDENGKPRVSGGKGSNCGTPQGGVISPLLANLYMNRFLADDARSASRRWRWIFLASAWYSWNFPGEALLKILGAIEARGCILFGKFKKGGKFDDAKILVALFRSITLRDHREHLGSSRPRDHC